MKETPILFNGAMVRAVLDGRKTQTRRICVPRYDDRKPCEHYSPIGSGGVITDVMMRHCEHGSEGRGCPYGKPGDRLYVKHFCWIWGSWKKNGLTPSGRQKWRFYEIAPLRAVDEKPAHTAKRNGEDGWVYRHGRFMPRWASRITLEVVSVRVERVQEISEADAIAEGVVKVAAGYNGMWTAEGLPTDHACHTAVQAFGGLWHRINGNRKDEYGRRLPYAWSDNPWVWVVEFRKING